MAYRGKAYDKHESVGYFWPFSSGDSLQRLRIHFRCHGRPVFVAACYADADHDDDYSAFVRLFVSGVRCLSQGDGNAYAGADGFRRHSHANT